MENLRNYLRYVVIWCALWEGATIDMTCRFGMHVAWQTIGTRKDPTKKMMATRKLETLLMDFHSGWQDCTQVPGWQDCTQVPETIGQDEINLLTRIPTKKLMAARKLETLLMEFFSGRQVCKQVPKTIGKNEISLRGELNSKKWENVVAYRMIVAVSNGWPYCHRLLESGSITAAVNAILKLWIEDCCMSWLKFIVSQTSGSTSRDLRGLVVDAGAFAISRGLLMQKTSVKGEATKTAIIAAEEAQCHGKAGMANGVIGRPQDIKKASNGAKLRKGFAMGTPKMPDVKWEDVGGLEDVKKAILDTVQKVPIAHCYKDSLVLMVATIEDEDSVVLPLRHCFTHEIALGTPNENDRLECFCHYIGIESVESNSSTLIEDVLGGVEGFIPTDNSAADTLTAKDDKEVLVFEGVQNKVIVVEAVVLTVDVNVLVAEGEQNKPMGLEDGQDTRFGGTTATVKLVMMFVGCNAACIHLEDQIYVTKKCGLIGGKGLVNTSEHINRLVVARLQMDIMGMEHILVARSDFVAATLIQSNIDSRDHFFILGASNPTVPNRHLVAVRNEAAAQNQVGAHLQAVEDAWLSEADVKHFSEAVTDNIKSNRLNQWFGSREGLSHTDARASAPKLGVTHVFWVSDLPRNKEGFHMFNGITKACIAKGCAFASHVDLLLMETATSEVVQAREFVKRVKRQFADVMLTYTLSASEMTDVKMQNSIPYPASSGLSWQFIPLAGFYTNALVGDTLARAFAQRGTLDYVGDIQRQMFLQEKKVLSLWVGCFTWSQVMLEWFMRSQVLIACFWLMLSILQEKKVHGFRIIEQELCMIHMSNHKQNVVPFDSEFLETIGSSLKCNKLPALNFKSMTRDVAHGKMPLIFFFKMQGENVLFWLKYCFLVLHHEIENMLRIQPGSKTGWKLDFLLGLGCDMGNTSCSGGYSIKIEVCGYSIKLEVPMLEHNTVASWFTKGTVNSIVNMPELLEHMSCLGVELIQLHENPSTQVMFQVVSHQVEHLNQGICWNWKCRGCCADTSESQKLKYLRIVEACYSTLQKELGMIFARAATASYSLEDMHDPLVFAYCFGAARLKEDLCGQTYGK